MKSEKGSITLYVLIAMITITAFLIGIYVKNSNDISVQIATTERIKAIYENYDITEVYYEIDNSAPIILDYTASINSLTIKTLIQNGANIDQNGREIIGYAATNNTNEPNKDVTSGNFGGWQTSKTINTTGQSKVFIWIKNEDGKISKPMEVKEKLITIAEAKRADMLTKTENSVAIDDYGNKVTIPAGFKVTDDADNITQGIVITDLTNEFVWIPVGNVANETETKTINLRRYVFNTDGTINKDLSVTNPEDQLKISSSDSYYRIEGKKSQTTSNTHAIDIEAFITSTKTNGGYYIGRYEASKNSSTGKAESNIAPVWNSINQANAANACRNMYQNKPFTIDLVNSYAWDTAIVFIQNFGTNSNYSNQSSLNTSLKNTGTNEDEQLNIHDMSSNVIEWTTETCSRSGSPCVNRGGYCNDSRHYTARRNEDNTTSTYGSNGFRALLYI